MFRWLCDSLGGVLRPERGEPPGAWPDDPHDVEALVTLAGHHFVTPALAFALRENGTVPIPVREYLEAALYLNGERNRRLLDGLELAAGALSAHGITPMLLKGAANLVDGLYPDPAIRFMGDLDLLVAPDEAIAASEALAQAGFDGAGGRPPGAEIFVKHHHLPMQIHRDTGVGIELHHSALDMSYRHILEAARMRDAALVADFRGVPVELPTPTHRVLHNIVHDQLGDGAYARRSSSLRQLLDLSLLCDRYRDAIDWAELEVSFGKRHRRALRYALGLTRLFGAAPPLGDPAASLARLRRGVEHPQSFLRRGVRRSASGLIRRPQEALKLLKPAGWRARWGFWKALAAPPRA